MASSAMPPKTVALIGAVCLTTGWLLAAVLTPPVATLQELPVRRPEPHVAPSSSAEPFSEQLRLGLERVPAAPIPRRNPFVFGGRTRTTAESTAAAPPSTPAAVAVEAVPVGPIYALSGIAVASTSNGNVLTAVLTDGQTVHLVKVGSSIGGYLLVEATENSATLADAAGTRHVLRLR
jgi:hypothetical protein